ncbi:MAG TPA: Holliday junction resolvase RuvX [Coriobacteriia bacterium]
MRALALDIGEKRIGVAVSDPSGRVATPVVVLDAAKVLGDGRDLVKLVEDYEVEVLVVGLPLSMDGSEGPQAKRVRSAASRLAGFLRTPIEFVDERLSSAEASKAMHATGASSREQRGSVDMVAASLFLQSYLDARRDDGRIGDKA